jgi:CHASE2 domain-containing sensor protein
MSVNKSKKKTKANRVQLDKHKVPALLEAERKKTIRRDLLKGLACIVFVLAVKLALEHTATGKQFELVGYNLLQDHLVRQSVPVQIVDISALPASKQFIDGKVYEATSREALTKIIDAIAEQDPAAIGIDIDFSPDKSYVTPRDPDFFQYCLDKGVPIFLGVDRTHLLPPKVWLNLEKYEVLGASIIVPQEGTKRMPRRIQTGPNFAPGKTMGSALATVFGESYCTLANKLQQVGLAEQVSKKELGHGGSVEEFLVDYSPLKGLIDNRIVINNPNSISVPEHAFRNKIVLIGEATPGIGPDAFVVSNSTESVRGVYIHACAAYTLAVAPLYELNWKGRVAIDLALSLSILLPLTIIRLRFALEPQRVATERLQTILTVLVVIAAFTFGVVFVSLTCIMWSDFVLALGAISFHPSISRRLEALGTRIRRFGPSTLRHLILEQDEEERK